MGRMAAGVRGITIGENDWVEEVASFDADADADILVITDRGYGKRTPLEEFRIQGRGGKGIILIRLTERNGMVAGIRCVTENDQVLLVTEQGIVIRTRVEEIRSAGRATQGVRVIRLGEGDRVVSVAKVVDAEEEEVDEEFAAETPEDPQPGAE